MNVFRVDAAAEDEAVDERKAESYAERVLREDTEKVQKKQKKSEYRSEFNSNKCERLFSGTKLVMTDQRKWMDPSSLEMVTMLDENIDLWGPFDIQDIAHAWKRGCPAGEVKEDEDDILYMSNDDDSEEEGGNFGLNVDIHAAEEN